MNDLFESDEWFGGKNVLIVGDILQLPPVRGEPVFDKVTASTLKYRLGSMGAVNIWRDSVTYDKLTINERQKLTRNFQKCWTKIQFPLILAFAVTIHKCQGLSLDNAIIDLSDNVFSARMAYVALSRVRTLSGVHLTCFIPKSLMVSSCSIKEINRLRQLYRPDLPQYAIPTDSGSRKRTLTETIYKSG
uniref:ATP-dependent DNA helicase n=1 Tax=Amphimedon queenslandica TaxID=400682 RepID=A0A1X7V6H2_AMPQE